MRASRLPTRGDVVGQPGDNAARPGASVHLAVEHHARVDAGYLFDDVFEVDVSAEFLLLCETLHSSGVHTFTEGCRPTSPRLGRAATSHGDSVPSVRLGVDPCGSEVREVILGPSPAQGGPNAHRRRGVPQTWPARGRQAVGQLGRLETTQRAEPAAVSWRPVLCGVARFPLCAPSKASGGADSSRS